MSEGSVSYTHLDVYKRQVHGCLPKLFRIHLTQTFVTLDLVILITSDLCQDRIQFIITVSIPFLFVSLNLIKRRLCKINITFTEDVYKRQAYILSATDTFLLDIKYAPS